MAGHSDNVSHHQLAGWMRGAAYAVVIVVPLLVIPGLETPFSTPKTIVLAAWVALGLAALVWARANPLARLDPVLFALLAGWLGAVALSALTGAAASPAALLAAVLPAAAFIVLLGLRPKPDGLMRAAAAAGLAVALVAVLQWAGADPFRLFGWTGPAGGSDRLRVFATLGNPNFVAAFLTAALPAVWAAARTLAPPWRLALIVPGAALVTGGILATGSRAPVAAVLAWAGWALLRSAARRTRLALGLALGLAAAGALVVMLSTARPLDETMRGRAHIWRTALAHVTEAPWLGFGPGGFELFFPRWETDRLAAAPATERRFAGLAAHAHNDYVEALVDHGVLGLALFVAFPAVMLWRFAAARKAEPTAAAAGAAAGAVGVLAVACVDFPFHRPAETFFFWLYLSIVCDAILSFPTAPKEPQAVTRQAAPEANSGGPV
ncbi:MAG TPA: O-antigen ligase family protein [Acidobacteriota bacterium]|jgi:O-antigen ligase|nr:O-antigen ligase family protein [Acidobacteriota bacterium]HNR38150.1 O-antigen ligase family protein [Acidobacteriota bacterium]HNU00685.1 O-antigen ligase family protein [Acidobacteriota bacterium]HPB28597.1 O-antigen ligase family protein [Acidobacteriota bacterium]HQP74767.1 O-antigen ligase family protein [Acidobacteriota bacterium]